MTEGMLDDACDFLMQEERAVAYAISRGILPGSLRKYKLGARAEGSQLAGRLLLPIRTPAGSPLTWTARVYDYGCAYKPKAKWLHWSPENSKFRKSDTLVFLHEHRKAISDRGVLCLFESPLDALVTGQYGFPSCAYMGSFISGNQAAIAASMAGVWLLWQDYDEAGERGYEKLSEYAEMYGVKLKKIVDERGDAATVLSDHGGFRGLEKLKSVMDKYAVRSVDYCHGIKR